MKISVDDKELYSLSETQKKVICNDIPDEVMESDMKRRLDWVLKHKYDQCFKRLKKEWEPKLKERGLKSIPLEDEKFAQLVFKQKDYESRSQREKKVK